MLEIKVKEEEKKISEFPKLMKSSKTGVIILAFERSTCDSIEGVVIVEGSNSKIGEFSSSWDSSIFKDFDSEITLSNK